MADRALGFLVEQMNFGVVQHDVDGVAGTSGGGRLHAGREAKALHVQIQIGFRAHQLGNFNIGHNLTVSEGFQVTGFVVDVFRTDTHHDFLVNVVLQHALLVLELGQRDLELDAAGGLGVLGAEFHIESIALFSAAWTR